MTASVTDEAKQALRTALKALSRRDHSEWEMRRALQRRGFSPDAVDSVVARLREAGYLDDARFARTFAESAVRNGRGYGVRIRIELLRRGVAESIIEESLGTLADEYEESALIRGLLAKRYPDFDPRSADDRQKRRVAGYFQRRGFSPAAILHVFRDRGE